MHHLGDIGNITADIMGKGQVEIMTDAWSVGTGAANDVVGRAAVLHADPDDYTSQPAGNAGSRIACGTIRLAD
jgi:Cu-Zn family superoxide dismutase